ncbi:MAG: helicase-associated domain-containing protein, partial [Chloroflexi bacterium]|nr:helicase-associated domain-containing protein [Chloroflexota bacterium]
MTYRPENPLIVQGDHTVLLEVASARYEEARDALARFAELEKSPEHVHTYRITPLSLWNAAASGVTAEHVLATLGDYGKYPLPGNVIADVQDAMSRYGRLKLQRAADGQLVLTSEDALLITELQHHRRVEPYIVRAKDRHTLVVRADLRGHLKQALVQIGYPAEDLAGYVAGQPLTVALREVMVGTGRPLVLRDYQREAVDVFWARGESRGGSGVIVLPCGAGKTVVGMAVMAKAQCHTLVLCHGTTAVHQWIGELIDKTHTSPDLIGEYTGDLKEIRPITVTTYQIVTYRPGRRKVSKETFELGDYPHLSLFTGHDWGLIIYDEV